MPRARALSAYPPEFWEIMERTGVRRDTITYPVVNHRSAMRLQGKFYAFRQAIKRELDSMKVHPGRFTPEQQGQVLDLWNWAQMTVCWFDRNSDADATTLVSFMHRDNTPEAQMLRQMLNANPASEVPLSTGRIDASLERLLEKLNAEEKK